MKSRRTKECVLDAMETLSPRVGGWWGGRWGNSGVGRTDRFLALVCWRTLAIFCSAWWRSMLLHRPWLLQRKTNTRIEKEYYNNTLWMLLGPLGNTWPWEPSIRLWDLQKVNRWWNTSMYAGTQGLLGTSASLRFIQSLLPLANNIYDTSLLKISSSKLHCDQIQLKPRNILFVSLRRIVEQRCCESDETATHRTSQPWEFHSRGRYKDNAELQGPVLRHNDEHAT